MKVYDFNVIEASEKTESLNLSEYGKTWCLNLCLAGYLVMLIWVVLFDRSVGWRVFGLAGAVCCLLVLLSNNNLLGGRRK